MLTAPRDAKGTTQGKPDTLAFAFADPTKDFIRNAPNQASRPAQYQSVSLKGGDPAAGSPTATLLRLHPSR